MFVIIVGLVRGDTSRDWCLVGQLDGLFVMVGHDEVVSVGVDETTGVKRRESRAHHKHKNLFKRYMSRVQMWMGMWMLLIVADSSLDHDMLRNRWKRNPRASRLTIEILLESFSKSVVEAMQARTSVAW